MTIRRLLVLPLLSPLLAVLLLAALNPSPSLSLRLLTWTTPRAPLALWLAGSALGGAVLSGAGTTLALRQGQGAGVRVRRRVASRSSRPWDRRGPEDREVWEELQEESAFRSPERFRRASTASQEVEFDPRGGSGRESPPAWRTAVGVAPPRAPGAPAPTVDVPFRILQRPVSAAGPVREREPVPVGVEDDWGNDDVADDW